MLSNKKGFTLIELLVVIAIVGILSTVAVVNLNSARRDAKIAAAKQYVSNVLPAILLCHDEGNIVQRDNTNACPNILPNGFGMITAGQDLCDNPAIDWPAFPKDVIFISCAYGVSGYAGLTLAISVEGTFFLCTDNKGCQ